MGLTNTLGTVPGFVGPSVAAAFTDGNVSIEIELVNIDKQSMFCFVSQLLVSNQNRFNVIQICKVQSIEKNIEHIKYQK